MRAIDILRKAKALVRKGWCKGSNRKIIHGKAHYCVSGAINRVSGYRRRPSRQLVLLAIKALEQHVPEKFRRGAVSYNDNFSTRKKQILRLFDKAIESLK